MRLVRPDTSVGRNLTEAGKDRSCLRMLSFDCSSLDVGCDCACCGLVDNAAAHCRDGRLGTFVAWERRLECLCVEEAKSKQSVKLSGRRRFGY